eukprot:11158757-Lingulodinium_polyedra.AAC.1
MREGPGQQRQGQEQSHHVESLWRGEAFFKGKQVLIGQGQRQPAAAIGGRIEEKETLESPWPDASSEWSKSIKKGVPFAAPFAAPVAVPVAADSKHLQRKRAYLQCVQRVQGQRVRRANFNFDGMPLAI